MWRQRRIRGRDIRAITFCLVTIPLAFFAAHTAAKAFGLDPWVPTLAATAAYAVWLLTRPRMLRVFRRLRGQSISEWSGYYDD